jgi:N-dimethylarginine dimethylaminohydrolase
MAARSFLSTLSGSATGSTAAAAAVWRINPFHYRRAIVRALAPDFAAKAVRQDASVSISQEKAAEQHAAYVTALKSVVPEVIELPAASGCPDSCFIEDTAVVIGDVALVTRPGAASRAGETAAVQKTLQDLGYRVVTAPAGASLDGGDVLFTGSEIFVGLSGRTNHAGVAAVQAAFPGLPVTPLMIAASMADVGRHNHSRKREISAKRLALFHRAQAAAAAAPAAGGKPAAAGAKTAAPVAAAGTGAPAAAAVPHKHTAACAHGHHDHAGHSHSHPLHLKSAISMIAPDTLAVADTDFGRAVAYALQHSSRRTDRLFHEGKRFLLVPDAEAANAVFANGVLIHRAASEFPASTASFVDHLAASGMGVEGVSMDSSAAPGAPVAASSVSHIGVSARPSSRNSLTFLLSANEMFAPHVGGLKCATADVFGVSR